MAHLARNPVHSPPALRALDLQVCPHTTLLPHKKPVPTCVNTGLTCMLYGARSLHALTCMLCGARNPTRLREALDAVLGDARKEQRLQLGGTLAKDQSLTEDALALVKTAFIAG